ncbi:MAG: hypothetical protein Q7R59_01210 [bacterium]|nr:hypothetical protein [bacterium]
MANVKLNFVLACDQAFQEDKSGKSSIIGIFNKIGAKGVPAVNPRFSIVVSTYGDPGNYVEVLKIINKQDNSVIASVKGNIEIKLGGKNTFVSNFTNVMFPVFGQYWFEVTVDGNVLTSPELHYVVVEKNN